MSCHVPNSLREEAASTKKSLFKEIQKSRHACTHPDVNLSNVQRKEREVREVCMLSTFALTSNDGPQLASWGESNLRYSNICCSTRRILMVIKQKVTVFPLSPAGDLHDTLVNVTHVGT